LAIALLVRRGANSKLPKHVHQGIWQSPAVAIWCVLQFIWCPQGCYDTGQRM